MAESLKTLFTSKRALVALVTLLVEVALALGWIGDLSPEMIGQLATWAGAIGLVLIGGISASDATTALRAHSGHDHKGRPLGSSAPKDGGS